MCGVRISFLFILKFVFCIFAVQNVILVGLMKQIVINLPENKYDFFIELVKNLGFVAKNADKTLLTQKQIEFVEGTKNALNDVSRHLNGEIKLKTVDQLLDEL